MLSPVPTVFKLCFWSLPTPDVKAWLFRAQRLARGYFEMWLGSRTCILPAHCHPV